jgi:hypothetical protein
MNWKLLLLSEKAYLVLYCFSKRRTLFTIELQLKVHCCNLYFNNMGWSRLLGRQQVRKTQTSTCETKQEPACKSDPNLKVAIVNDSSGMTEHNYKDYLALS